MVTIDYITLGVFLAGIFFLGSILYKWIGVPDDYFVAGRNLPPFILAATLVATNVNLYTFIGQTGAAYQEGISISWHAWTGNMALVFSGLFVLPIFRRLRIRTIPEYLEIRYNRLVRSIVGLLWIFRLAFWLGITMYTGAIAAETLTGIHSFTLWLFVFAVIAVGFTTLGGAWSVALTDALQFVLMLGGGLVLLPLAMKSVGWLPGLIEKLPAGHFDFVTQTGHYNWLFIFAITLLGIQWACTDQGMMQRAFGAENTRSIAKGMVWAGVITTPFVLIIYLPGLVAAVTNPGLENFDMAVPMLMSNLLMPFVLGLMVCGLMASHLSTVDANLHAVATVFTSDIYHNVFNRQASERTILIIVRITTCLAGAFMIALAYLVPRLGGAVQAYLTIICIMDMPLFVVAILYGLLWRRTNWQGALAGYTAGAVAGVIGRFVVGLDVNVTTFISAGAALVVCPVVTLLSSAPSKEKVLGVWKAKDVSQEELDSGSVYHIFPKTIKGKMGLSLLILGGIIFIVGTAIGSTGAAALASVIAISGMVVYFLGGIVKVYSD